MFLDCTLFITGSRCGCCPTCPPYFAVPHYRAYTVPLYVTHAQLFRAVNVAVHPHAWFVGWFLPRFRLYDLRAVPVPPVLLQYRGSLLLLVQHCIYCYVIVRFRPLLFYLVNGSLPAYVVFGWILRYRTCLLTPHCTLRLVTAPHCVRTSYCGLLRCRVAPRVAVKRLRAVDSRWIFILPDLPYIVTFVRGYCWLFARIVRYWFSHYGLAYRPVYAFVGYSRCVWIRCYAFTVTRTFGLTIAICTLHYLWLYVGCCHPVHMPTLHYVTTVRCRPGLLLPLRFLFSLLFCSYG